MDHGIRWETLLYRPKWESFATGLETGKERENWHCLHLSLLLLKLNYGKNNPWSCVLELYLISACLLCSFLLSFSLLSFSPSFLLTFTFYF
jgi:hypothetical protein